MKDLLVLANWTVSAEGRFNWILTRGGNQIVVPKRGEMLSLTIFEDILTKARLDPGQFWELLSKTGFDRYADLR